MDNFVEAYGSGFCSALLRLQAESIALPGDLAAYPWHKECLERKTA